jgi:hypothetical protein
MTFKSRIDPLLSLKERAVFKKLSSPQKIQDFLDHFPARVSGERHTMRGPLAMLKAGRAHCMEGAMFAAASLAYHGGKPLLMDLRSAEYDLDHVVALFKQNNLWGAISKTNHPVLRWRDPVYRSVRELAMSYFHEYYLNSGEKTLLDYSRPLDLSSYDPEEWVNARENVDWLADGLDEAVHFPLYPRSSKKYIRPASRLETEATKATEWPKQKRA